VGLAGYDLHSSLLQELEAEQARHAAWQQAQVLPASPVQSQCCSAMAEWVWQLA
jgi:hypothetical protein